MRLLVYLYVCNVCHIPVVNLQKTARVLREQLGLTLQPIREEEKIDRITNRFILVLLMKLKDTIWIKDIVEHVANNIPPNC